MKVEEGRRDGHMRRTVIEHKGDLHPQIVIEDEHGQDSRLLLPPRTGDVEVEEGAQISAGTLLAKTPREAGGTQDITGGLPRVTELFEARKPKDPAVIAEIDGKSRSSLEKKRGKRVIIVQGRTALIANTWCRTVSTLRVHTGDPSARAMPSSTVRWCRTTFSASGRRSRAAVPAPRSPERVPAQRVEIDDKHIEIVVSQMLRKVRIDDRRRHRPAAGNRHRQVRVPPPESATPW
jgi:DNA-directed RNA polymerase subunit beta'